MRAFLISAALVLLVAFPAAADATSLATRRAVAVADTVWGKPCGGTHVTIRWGSIYADHKGTAEWTGADGRYMGDGPPELRTNCRVSIDTTFARENRKGEDWPLYCTAIVHEFGHLTGHDHSADPLDVMYPVMSVSSPRCEMASPLFWLRPA